jgi:hypothetical protein
MKNIFISAIALLLMVSFARSEDYKFFPQKSGILQYKMTGFMEGKQTVYFDDYGQKYIIEQDMMYFGALNKSKTMIVRDSSFSIDLVKNQGYKFQDPDKSAYLTVYQLVKDPNKAYQDLYTSQGGKVIGKEKIKNVECEIWELSKGLKKIWLGNGIVYKTELKESGKTGVIELYQADFNFAFDKDFFKKADITYKVFGVTKGK